MMANDIALTIDITNNTINAINADCAALAFIPSIDILLN